jgi:hypothetical protein
MIPYNDGITSSTGSVHSMGLVAKWLKDCLEQHPECNDAFSRVSFVPSRLIEITGVSETCLKASLREKTQIPSDACYTTLSHCWGSAVPFKLLSSNRNALSTDIPLLDLSKVFQDAILLTWRLKIRYIWIDSLCKLSRPVVSNFTEQNRHHPGLNH